MVLEKLDRYMKRIKLNHFLTPYTKINSKWIYLNVKPETIKVLGENIGSTFFNISLSSIILGMSPQVRATKAKINKWNYIKLKSFFTVKTKSQHEKATY